MEVSIFLAKVMGVMYTVAGLGMLINLKRMKSILDDFAKSPALTYFGGFFILILGMLVVMHHNVWTGDFWYILITLIGWLALVKGAFWLLFPSLKVKMLKWVQGMAWYVVSALVALAIGVYLGYMGFWMV